MRKLRFYKEKDLLGKKRWYVDLPEWVGNKSDLEMVQGADKMLEIMTKGRRDICLSISDRPFTGADKIRFTHPEEEFGGAWYIMEEFEYKKYDLKMWICAVAEFVFGKMPNIIYVKRIDKL